jgi:tetratricopeptide (TPR) repeat protein
MVKKGLQYLDSLSRETGQDPALLWDLARGYEKIAALQASPDPGEPNLADHANGLQSYRRALSFAEAVERARGRDQDLVLLLCRIHLGIGSLSPDTEEATRHVNESLRLSLLLGPGTPKFYGPDAPETGTYFQSLAWNRLGNQVLDSDPAKAFEYFSKAPKINPPGAGQTPNRSSLRASALALMGDLEGGVAMAKDSLEGLRKLQANYPHENIRKRVMRVTAARIEFGVAGVQGSPFRMNLGDSAAAVAACRRAITILDGVLARDPSDGEAQSRKLEALSTLGAVLSAQDPAESVKAYTQVLSSRAYPGRAPVNPTITDARWQISYPLRRLGRRQEALEAALRSVTERPVANAYNAAGDAQLDLGRPEAALEQYRMALAAAERRASAVLAGTYGHLGRYYESTRDWQAAREWYGKAHGVWANWTKAGGVSNPFVIRSEREMARAVARCDVRGKR